MCHSESKRVSNCAGREPMTASSVAMPRQLRCAMPCGFTVQTEPNPSCNTAGMPIVSTLREINGNLSLESERLIIQVLHQPSLHGQTGTSRDSKIIQGTDSQFTKQSSCFQPPQQFHSLSSAYHRAQSDLIGGPISTVMTYAFLASSRSISVIEIHRQCKYLGNRPGDCMHLS